jgi:hypothetical protein
MGQLHGGTDKHERVHIDFRIYEANPPSIQRDLGGLRIHEEGVEKDTMPPGHSEVGAPTPQQIDKRAAAKEVIDILMEIATLLVRVTSSLLYIPPVLFGTPAKKRLRD